MIFPHQGGQGLPWGGGWDVTGQIRGTGDSPFGLEDLLGPEELVQRNQVWDANGLNPTGESPTKVIVANFS